MPGYGRSYFSRRFGGGPSAIRGFVSSYGGYGYGGGGYGGYDFAAELERERMRDAREQIRYLQQQARGSRRRQVELERFGKFVPAGEWDADCEAWPEKSYTWRVGSIEMEICRGPTHAWNGYVTLPEGYPHREKPYDFWNNTYTSGLPKPPVRELTYGNAEGLLGGVTPVGKFGFDHSWGGDRQPMVLERGKAGNHDGCVYTTAEMAINEVWRLAAYFASLVLDGTLRTTAEWMAEHKESLLRIVEQDMRIAEKKRIEKARKKAEEAEAERVRLAAAAAASAAEAERQRQAAIDARDAVGAYDRLKAALSRGLYSSMDEVRAHLRDYHLARDHQIFKQTMLTLYGRLMARKEVLEEMVRADSPDAEAARERIAQRNAAAAAARRAEYERQQAAKKAAEAAAQEAARARAERGELTKQTARTVADFMALAWWHNEKAKREAAAAAAAAERAVREEADKKAREAAEALELKKKRLVHVKQLLADIEVLKARREAGETLDPLQVKKMTRRQALEKEEAEIQAELAS